MEVAHPAAMGKRDMKPTVDRAGQTGGRVSPTAPDTHSPSTAVWRLLEQNAEFRDGMERARQDFEAGRVAPFRHRAPRPQR